MWGCFVCCFLGHMRGTNKHFCSVFYSCCCISVLLFPISSCLLDRIGSKLEGRLLMPIVVVPRECYSRRRRLEKTSQRAYLVKDCTGQGEDRAVWGVASVLTRRGEWHEFEGWLVRESGVRHQSSRLATRKGTPTEKCWSLLDLSVYPRWVQPGPD